MRRKLSLWWLAVAALLFVAGTGGGIAVLVHGIISLPEGHTFLVPSTQTFQLAEPGPYVVWHDYQTTIKGKVFNKPAELPDQTTITLTHKGKEIPTAKLWSSTITSGQHQKVSIARYHIEEPGAYSLTVEGLAEPRVFTFSRPIFKPLFQAILSGVFLILFGWLGASIGVAFILILRSRKGDT